MTSDAPASRLLFDLPAAVEAVRRGDVTSLDLVEASLDRIARLDPELHAIAWCDQGRARDLAGKADSTPLAVRSSHALHGVPLGVKDIFDAAGTPTEHGSPLFAGRVAERSAAAVSALEASGAIITAKTVTTPLAYLEPGPTRNPWKPDRTPGGSSMGSAVAVATGMLPGAIGTQSSGSVIRPAAYCGIVGFKPTAGRISTAGVLDFSATLDQVGCFARSVEGVALLTAAMAAEPLSRWSIDGGARPRFIVPLTDEWDRAEPAMRRAYDHAVERVAACGASAERRPLPPSLDGGVPCLRVIAASEAARSLGNLVQTHRERVSPGMLSFFREGARITDEEYKVALVQRTRAIKDFDEWAADGDAVLAPPTIGEAPGRETTGDPRFCSPWSLVGAPVIVLPIATGPSRLPLGLQMVGPRGLDARLLAAARWIETRLDARAAVPPLS